LRVQRRAEVSPSRVQSIAVNRLKMRTPDPSITAYVSQPSGDTQ
jgi:cell division protein FtsL